MTELEQRNALFTAALREYEHKGFTLNEAEDCIELRHNGLLVDKFSWQVPIAAIRNSCEAHLILDGGSVKL
jgi:hypothetical protein